MSLWRVLIFTLLNCAWCDCSMLSEECLRCLCAASSDCQPNSRCRVIEPDTYLCGPFRLTEHYWLSSGMLTPNSVRRNNPLAFEACALDLECSIHTVSHLVHTFIERCRLPYSRWDHETQCILAAFVHYRALYSRGEADSDEADLADSMFTCDVNATKDAIEEHIGRLYSIAPATRADDSYWPRFEECTESVT